MNNNYYYVQNTGNKYFNNYKLLYCGLLLVGDGNTDHREK